jgi:excinuclease UvrABC nuclease subunit
MVPYFHLLRRVKSESKKIPTISAVYFIYTDPDIILYVGQAVNLQQRWKSHRFLRMVLDEFKIQLAWLPCELGVLSCIERYYIQKLRPPLNKIHSRGVRTTIGPRYFIEDRIAVLKTYNI